MDDGLPSCYTEVDEERALHHIKMLKRPNRRGGGDRSPELSCGGSSAHVRGPLVLRDFQPEGWTFESSGSEGDDKEGAVT